VDTLSLGDASPTELQSLLGMPSNLLAHHLGTLEREGLLTRHRSEADRRRSYLRLVPTALEGLLAAAVIAAPRVVFVCTANSARSQLAAALWRRTSTVPVASAGTHPTASIAPGAIAAARRHDVRLPRARPRLLAEILHRDDYVVTVCDNAHEELHATHQVAAVHWSVPDPVRDGTDKAFDAVLALLHKRVVDLAPRVTTPDQSVTTDDRRG